MEGRGFLERNAAGLWSLTKAGLAERENPSPSLVKVKVKRLTNEKGVITNRPDDAKVPRIATAAHRLGWTTRWRTTPIQHVAPDGREYVAARQYETADLIVEWPKDGYDYAAMGTCRLRLLATSKAKQEQNKKERVEYERNEAKRIKAGVKKSFAAVVVEEMETKNALKVKKVKPRKKAHGKK